MAGLFGILQSGKRSLIAQQFAQTVVGNNIANVNTKGYSRQSARLIPAPSVNTAYGRIGMGVNIDGVKRSRNAFLDKIYRDANSELTQWQAQQFFLEQVDALFADVDESGIGSQMDRFFNAWYDLSNDPESSQARIAVKESGKSMSRTFNRVARGLTDQRKNINGQVQALVDRVNDLTSKIAELNAKIPRSDSNLTQENELKDQQDLLIDELTDILDVEVIYTENSGVNLYVDSLNIVAGATSLTLETEYDASGDIPLLNISGVAGVAVDITGGELGGILELRDEIITGYQDKLNTLAQNIVEQVNIYHKAGYTLNGDTGMEFFDHTKITAETMALSSDVLDDVSNIAAASEDAQGDNSQALLIAGLKDAPLIDETSFRDYYNSIIQAIGEDTRMSTVSSQNFEIIKTQAELQKEGVSGVSLDEEMIDMIRYQRAYGAAARLISTVDSMIETLLSLR